MISTLTPPQSSPSDSMSPLTSLSSPLDHPHHRSFHMDHYPGRHVTDPATTNAVSPVTPTSSSGSFCQQLNAATPAFPFTASPPMSTSPFDARRALFDLYAGLLLSRGEEAPIKEEATDEASTTGALYQLRLAMLASNLRRHQLQQQQESMSPPSANTVLPAEKVRDLRLPSAPPQWLPIPGVTLPGFIVQPQKSIQQHYLSQHHQPMKMQDSEIEDRKPGDIFQRADIIKTPPGIDHFSPGSSVFVSPLASHQLAAAAAACTAGRILQSPENQMPVGLAHQSAQLQQSNPYPCSDCGRSYSTPSNLARHRQSHRGNGTGVCVSPEPAMSSLTGPAVCAPTTASSVNVTSPHHATTVSTNLTSSSSSSSSSTGTPRKCPHCDKIYSSAPAYSMHVRTHSQGCACPQCGKRFSRPWLLQGHLRTHTGERPFGCPHCGKTFADKSNLRAHVQTHSTDKPHVCGRCGKAFALRSYLYKHEESSCMRSHRIFHGYPYSSGPQQAARHGAAGRHTTASKSAATRAPPAATVDDRRLFEFQQQQIPLAATNCHS